MNIGTSVNAIQTTTNKTKRGVWGGGVPTSVSGTGECVYSGSVYASALYRKPVLVLQGGRHVCFNPAGGSVGGWRGGGGFQGQGNSCLV